MVSRNRTLAAVGAVAMALLVWSFTALQSSAQVRGRDSRHPGMPTRERPARDVTVTGRVVDLHCAMTGNRPTADEAKCTADCIRNGVPAALETEEGYILLGQGATGPAKVLIPLAFEQVEVRGKLFEKGGVRYLDIASIQKFEEEGEDEDESPEEEEE